LLTEQKFHSQKQLQSNVTWLSNFNHSLNIQMVFDTLKLLKEKQVLYTSTIAFLQSTMFGIIDNDEQ